MFNAKALRELVMVSDHISIIGKDYELLFDKDNIIYNGSWEEEGIVFTFEHHTKTLLAKDIVHIVWELEGSKLIIFEERKENEK